MSYKTFVDITECRLSMVVSDTLKQNKKPNPVSEKKRKRKVEEAESRTKDLEPEWKKLFF